MGSRPARTCSLFSTSGANNSAVGTEVACTRSSFTGLSNTIPTENLNIQKPNCSDRARQPGTSGVPGATH
jgi:hypothetical protein